MKICTMRKPDTRPWSLLGLVFSLAVMPVTADDDLGVTMRMVTDDDLTGAVTREIALPRPTTADKGQGKGQGAVGASASGNPFMDGGPPGQQGRPDLSPSELRRNAADKASDRRSDARNTVTPGRPERPDRAGSPNRPERPGESRRP